MLVSYINKHWLSKQILIYSGHHGIVEFLIERGADVNVRDAKGKAAIDLASEKGIVILDITYSV